MRQCGHWRGMVVLLVTPLLTGLVSVAGILLTMLGRSDREIQFLPRWWGRVICRLSGVRVAIHGLERLDHSRSYIFAANHQSQFDIFVLQGFLDFDFRWLAKKELFQIPVFGPAMRKAGYIPVDRSRGRQALRSLEEAARRIREGTSVVIFPEGTRSPDGRLRPFKAGAMVLAIKAGVEVVPMAILGTHAILPKGRLLARPGRVWVEIGEPIATAGYSPKQKHELAQLLQERVASLLTRAGERAGVGESGPGKASAPSSVEEQHAGPGVHGHR